MDCIKPREDDDGAEPGFFGKLFDAANAVAARAAKRRKTMQATANKLAGHIDVDNMDDYFKKLVGSDDMMDREEFERFSKELNLTRGQATNLWFILDRDGNGLIDKAEFEEAHSSMQAARAWSRYCPECIYSNTCAFCLETNANCVVCTDNAFCASCWADHPARHKVAEGEDEQQAKQMQLGTTEQLRTQLIIRPLNWAYTSPFMAWLPVAQKGALRQALRYQQQKVDEAVKAAQEEEEAALNALR